MESEITFQIILSLKYGSNPTAATSPEFARQPEHATSSLIVPSGIENDQMCFVTDWRPVLGVVCLLPDVNCDRLQLALNGEKQDRKWMDGRISKPEPESND